MPSGNTAVPAAPGEPGLPAVRRDDPAADEAEPPVALTTTMVAMAARTSPMGTSAVVTGWRARNDGFPTSGRLEDGAWVDAFLPDGRVPTATAV